MEVDFLSFVDVQRLVQNDTIEVKWVLQDVRSDAMFYVFHETKMQIVQHDQQRIWDLIETAKEVSTEEEYLALKNNRQREIYLSQYYLLTKVDAADVIELLKPEMAVLFKEEEHREEQ